MCQCLPDPEFLVFSARNLSHLAPTRCLPMTRVMAMTLNPQTHMQTLGFSDQHSKIQLQGMEQTWMMRRHMCGGVGGGGCTHCWPREDRCPVRGQVILWHPGIGAGRRAGERGMGGEVACKKGHLDQSQISSVSPLCW